MQVVEDVRVFSEDLPGLCLTIGSFDGLHLGHRRIIDRLQAAARARGGTAALMTLRPHPRQFFAPESVPNLLTGDGQKERLLAELGVDVLFVLPFDASVANLPREQFLEDIVLERCRARHLVVGHDFAFGRGATGDYAWLAGQAPARGFTVEEVAPLIVGGERISSTLIREALLQGELEQAEGCLGRRYAIAGEVVRGRGVGVQLGFPTANIRPGAHVIPAHGVYAAEARFDGRRCIAAVNIGIAPTVRHEDITVEAFLLDFEGDIVGQSLELVFHRRLRPEVKFPDWEALKAAIAADVAAIRGYFAGEGSGPVELFRSPGD